MAWIDRIKACQNWKPEGYGYLYDHKGQVLGRPRKDFMDVLRDEYGDVFSEEKPYHIRLHEKFETFEQRSFIINDVLNDIQKKHRLFPLWRGETWRAATDFYSQAEFYLERGCVAHFGLKAWGVHVNGFVRKKQGLYLWVAKRAAHKAAWPSRLDQIVAGGQPADISPMENVIKEAEEEAGIPRHMAEKAKSVGAISYIVDWQGLHRDEMFVFDLELPEDFTPKPVDGEVESFALMPVSKVMDIVEHTEQFKDNCALVLIDFFIRHGLLTPSHPDYLKIIKGLH